MEDSWKIISPIAAPIAALLVVKIRTDATPGYWTMTAAFAAVTVTLLGSILPGIWSADPLLLLLVIVLGTLLAFGGLALVITVRSPWFWVLPIAVLALFPAIRVEVLRLLAGSLMLTVAFWGIAKLLHLGELMHHGSGIEGPEVLPSPDFHDVTDDWYLQALERDMEIEF